MSVSQSLKRDWRMVQRRRRFRQYYLDTGNALQSALAAGYSEVTAKTQNARMAAHVEETMRDQCDLLGVTKLLLVQTLLRHLRAKEPRWNAKKEKWDLFENVTAQRDAYDRLKAILEPEEPKVINLNMRIGVAVNEKRKNETPEEWQTRQATRIATVAAEQAVQTVLGEVVSSGGNGDSGS
ncbi:MAG: terminase small subunit [Acidobacteria bacterium]|nr:terminase small subunit [Acidobacteriota bacterium]